MSATDVSGATGVSGPTPASPPTRTKLMCTLGPATNTPAFVRGLVAAGATIFRVNFSHGTLDDHARAVALVREAEAEGDRSLAVLVDLPGPKVRLGTMHPDPFRFVPGQPFSLRGSGPGDEGGASTTYPGLAEDLREGDRVLLADGAVELLVIATEGGTVQAECVRGGVARSGQGVNVPAERLDLPAVTDRDREGLARALDLDVDLIAQSFVRGPADLHEMRELMGQRVVPIVAKIETRPTPPSAERPSSPIFAFIPNERVRRVSSLYWGVVPLSAEHPSDTDAMVGLMDRGLLGRGLAEHGSLVVMAASSPAEANDDEHVEAARGRLPGSLIVGALDRRLDQRMLGSLSLEIREKER